MKRISAPKHIYITSVISPLLKVIRAIFSKVLNCLVNPLQSQLQENRFHFLKCSLQFSFTLRKIKTNLITKDSILYTEKHINTDGLPSGTVRIKVGFENLCSKHNQKVTECEAVINGKKLFGRCMQGRLSLLILFTSFSKCLLPNWGLLFGGGERVVGKTVREIFSPLI